MATSLKTTITADVSGIALKAPAVPASFITPCTELLTNVKKGRSAGSANATTVGYIEDVIQADTGIVLSTQNDGGDETRTIAIDNEAIALNIIGTAGENLSARDMVYLKESDGKWYKQDSNASNPVAMGRFRGCVPSAITINTTGTIRIKGKVTGFTGLTDGGKVWASTTAGSYTQTKPFATVGGAQIALSEMGYAYSSSVVWIEPKSLRYLKRATLADDDTMTVEHHADEASYGRDVRVIVREAVEGSVITSYSDTNWSTNYPLNGPSGAGETQTATGTGTSRNIGDDEDRQAAQRINASGIVSSITVTLGASNGTPSGNITWEIQSDNSGDPSGTVLTSGEFTPVASSDNTFSVPNGINIGGANYFHLVLRASDPQSNLNYWTWVSTTGGGGSFGGTSKYLSSSANGGASWTNFINDDMKFSITCLAHSIGSRLGQSFQVGSGDTVSKVRLYLGKFGSPSGDLSVGIYDGATSPTTLLGTSNTVSASAVSAAYDWVEFIFDTPPSISASTTYWIVLQTTDSQSNSSYVTWAIDHSSPAYASGSLKYYSGSWNTGFSADAIFEIYGAETLYYTPGKLVYWGADNAFENRLDDGAGSNPTINTTIKNTTGSEATVTAEVAFEGN